MTSITIEAHVVADDIACDAHDCASCPWALAIIRALKDAGLLPLTYDPSIDPYDIGTPAAELYEVAVGAHQATVMLAGIVYHIELSPRVVQWIRAYDSHELVDPASETLVLSN